MLCYDDSSKRAYFQESKNKMENIELSNYEKHKKVNNK